MNSVTTDRLKKATQEAHLALEGLLIPVIKKISTVNGYIHLLRLFYGYFNPLEDMVGLYMDTAFLPDYPERRKTNLLLHDLRQLGYTDPDADKAGKLPRISNVHQAFGALYVMEGSTLGGKIIAAMIRKNLQLASDDALSFFQGYGNATGSKWQAFTTALNQFADSHAETDSMIQAANETFIIFKHRVESKISYGIAEKEL